MRPHLVLFPALLLAVSASAASARDLQPRPEDPYFARYEGWKAPDSAGLLLQDGDRLAICGDSITEQKMYSRIIETYLTVCVPQLRVTCRQYGWSGEKADVFLDRMKDDVLRFQPTVATTCYGMNDHRYVPYTDEIGAEYRKNQTAIVNLFKEAGTRVVIGSPGTIGLMPAWVKTATGTAEDLNLSLLRLRNTDIEIAEETGVRFADVYWPMLTSGFEAQKKYGREYMMCGQDGVHPGWAGQTVMAYAFLKGLGVDGEIGTITYNAASGQSTGSAGHEVTTAAAGAIAVKSARYPFCAAGGDPSKDDNIRSAMGLIPFNETLNRFTLKITNAAAPEYAVTWGPQTRVYAKADLEKGVNLAADFHENPFTGAFNKVWDAVFAKQDYETRQVKTLFHGPEGAADLPMTVALTEKTREKFVASLAAAVQPVEHSLKIEARP